MPIKIKYKGEELSFDSVPNSAGLEAAYQARKGASQSVIRVCRPWPLRRDERPIDHGQSLEKHVVLWSAPGVPRILEAHLDAVASVADNGASETDPDGVVIDAVKVGGAAGVDATLARIERAVGAMRPGGRLVIIARRAGDAASAEQAAASRGLDAAMRSAGIKLAASGGTANLLTLAEGAEAWCLSAVRFLLSDRSSYITGQTLHIEEPVPGGVVGRPRDVFAGKVALVTGGTSGIGRAISELLVRNGATALCVGRPGSKALAEMQEGSGRIGVGQDLTDEAAPRSLVEVARSHGGIDLLVHSAGVSSGAAMAEMSLEQWRAPLAINMEAPMRITRALLDAGQLNSGGRIVYISSVAGLAGSPSYSSYAASKSGLIGVMRFHAMSLAERGFVVNAVAPGIIETRMFFDAMSAPVRGIASRMNVLGQVGQASDVANAVSFLCDASTRGVHGSVLRVCGGYFAGA